MNNKFNMREAWRPLFLFAGLGRVTHRTPADMHQDWNENVNSLGNEKLAQTNG